MKAHANRYSLSTAPTGRARCRACKQLVPRGTARLVTLAVVCERPRRVTTFVRHVACVDTKLAALVRSAHGNEVPVVGNVEPEAVLSMVNVMRQLDTGMVA